MRQVCSNTWAPAESRIFCDEADYRFFVKRLGELVEETYVDCFAWALIPNHFHLLLRTGFNPLATFMRLLTTSCAGYYNRRHERSGHLFQNRYKSLVCEEDPYFLELLRYIHLNPLRSGSVKDEVCFRRKSKVSKIFMTRGSLEAVTL